MTSQSIPSSLPIEAVNPYDDNSFINEDNNLQEHDGDSTRRPVFLPAEDRGFDFHLKCRDESFSSISCPRTRYYFSNTLYLFL
ncbi:Glyoxalase domain-containing protein 5 [Fusarium oxysporum f. sp. albedinis]|nr:Glyoxalase domain-containing protein 5 [Fusarium oxysporum f. sp. albedinis]